jgi:octaprenyl-diphosphate synthase
VMQHGTQAQAQLVRQAIEAGGREALGDVVAAVHATGALDATRMLAQQEATLAQEKISMLPASIFKDVLLQLCSFAVARNY